MATIKLVPSTYYRSNTSYVTVTDPANMYYDTSHTANYATLRGRNRNSSTAYYAFIGGFNFDAVPAGANVTGFTVRIRCYRNSNQRTGANFYMRLSYAASSGSVISNTTTSTNIGTSVSTIEIPTGSLTWSDIVGYGEKFSIEIPLASTSSSYPYVYVYGAEIEVTYSAATQYSVTVQNSSSATVSVSNTAPYEGDDVTVSINTLNGITVKDNNVDVTSQFVREEDGSISKTPDSAFTTGFSQSDANFYQNSSTTGTAYLEYAIGRSAESPYSTSNTSNTYVKPEGATGWINYEFDFSDIPSDANITSVSVKVYGAREDSTVDNTHVARFQCYSGTTAKGSIQNFTSTSNSLVTVSDVGTWTANELHNAVLRFELGYYGGRMLGITWTVTYEANGYVYTISSISTNHTIVVTSGGVTTKLYFKNNGSWISISKAYKKVNGSWVEQSDLSTLFNSSNKYTRGD